MPKPKGTIGGTKMKIMAVVCYNAECGQRSYGYSIWQVLKAHFHIYINDGDIRNVYHHLKGLCALDLLAREEASGAGFSKKCYYHLTEKGWGFKQKYAPYLEIVRRNFGSP